MATLTITVPAGGEAGAVLRQLSFAIERASANVPDRNPGQAVTCVLDNAPSSGICSVTIAGQTLLVG